MTHIENLEELDQVITISTALFEDTYHSSISAPYITMMGLFAAMVEQCKSLSILIHEQHFVATQSIVRNALEIYVDIKIVESDGNYVNYLWAEYYNREKELSRKKYQQNKYRKLRREAYELYKPSQNFDGLSIYDKFKLAGLQEDYKALYGSLSCHTHSGVFSLLNRVMETKKTNKLSEQGLFKITPSELEIAAIPLITYYLLDASEIIAKGHGDVPVELIKEFRQYLLNKSS
ncbi:DUF5677 domain-containing protein [Vibrio sp. 10N.222.49.C12]|uniref:DUF5677 domain-containing protein n=1 Tax=Vibrio sp. 10N.222.49.C12 TaxID=3229614 RepID=UPI00355195B8